tara:strand:+ start:100 stop:864 length:765 start_codon:yes stop_codon:yes gene_type:complete
MNRLAIIPQNNYNIWNLVAQGLINDDDVSTNGKIIDQEYIDYLGSLNLNNIEVSNNISNETRRRPQTARNPIRRSISVNNSNNITNAENNTNTVNSNNLSRLNTPRNLIRRSVSVTPRESNYRSISNNSNISRLSRPSIYRNISSNQENTRIVSNLNNNNNSNNNNVCVIKTPGARAIDISLNNVFINQNQNQNQNQIVKNDFTCVICLTNKRSYLISPCNHLCLCQNCALRIKNQNKCPICRKVNIKVQKVFL